MHGWRRSLILASPSPGVTQRQWRISCQHRGRNITFTNSRNLYLCLCFILAPLTIKIHRSDYTDSWILFSCAIFTNIYSFTPDFMPHLFLSILCLLFISELSLLTYPPVVQFFCGVPHVFLCIPGHTSVRFGVHLSAPHIGYHLSVDYPMLGIICWGSALAKKKIPLTRIKALGFSKEHEGTNENKMEK